MDVSIKIDKTPVYGYLILNSLLELGILEKKRKGRFMIYDVKPLEI